jgi:hypothetical protein
MPESRALYQADETEAAEPVNETAGRLRDRAHVFRILTRQIEADWKDWPHQQDRADVALVVGILNDMAAVLETEAEQRKKKVEDGR